MSEFGHQYKKEEKMLNACRKSLNQAYEDIQSIPVKDEIWQLKMDIVKLMNKCLELSYSANEAFKQNQD